MVGIAVVFGLLAVFVAQGWLNYQAELSRKTTEPKAKPVATRNIVIAAGPLRFGTRLNADALREVAWPEEAIPAGTFGSIADLMSGGKRIVLASIEKNEPILRTKVTGPGQKATLSAVIQDGMRAVTIRVNDVDGVGGFVLPGDHVDVLLTRQQERTNGMNDVVIQNARVLAVDQLADDAADRPTVVKAVTLEVDTISAQKIALAASLGSLSLMLRRAGEQVTGRDAPHHGERPGQYRSGAARAGGEALRQGLGDARRQPQEYNVAAEDGMARRRRSTGGGRAAETRDTGKGLDMGKHQTSGRAASRNAARRVAGGARRAGARRRGAALPARCAPAPAQAREIELTRGPHVRDGQDLDRQVGKRAHRRQLRRGDRERSGGRRRDSADRPLALDPRQEDRQRARLGLRRRQEAGRRVRHRGVLRHLAARQRAGAALPACALPRLLGQRPHHAGAARAPDGRDGRPGDDHRQAVRRRRHQRGAR